MAVTTQTARRRGRCRPSKPSDPPKSAQPAHFRKKKALEVEDEEQDVARENLNGRYDTPFRMPAPTSSHDRDAVHPYIREDLKSAKDVGFYVWTEAVLGLPYSSLLTWARQIHQSKWFEDKVVQDALLEYCRATTEKKRYDPFVHITNRIVELARGNLPGVDKTYPLNDFCIANNADRAVKAIPEHGPLGAKRRPDFLGLSAAEAVKLYKPRGRVHWADILLLGELKCLGDLTKLLSKERKSRRLSTLDDSGFPVDELKASRRSASSRHTLFAAKPTNMKTRKSPAASKPIGPILNAPQKLPARSYKGKKRLAEDDLLAGLDVSSSSQRRNPYSTTNELYVGGEAAVQSGSYALELLSCTYGTRAHCFSFVLKDDRLTLWYYDASGVLYTAEFISLIQDFELFAAVIVGFANCTLDRFGVLPSSVIQQPASLRKSLPPGNLSKKFLKIRHPSTKNEVTIILQKPLFTAYAIAGRRSFLYSIKTAPSIAGSKDLIMKFSYQVCTRKKEQDLVEIARKAGVKHLPRIYMWADLWNLSDGVRQIFYEKSRGAAQYEDRTLRAIVYTQYASVKELFQRSCEFIPVMVDQLIDCLYDLRYNANILHRDISIGNIMFRVISGRYYFILIDFDMAVVLPNTESSYVATSNHRTGTLPFMAYELIFNAANSNQEGWVPIPHVLRHDLESLFWVSLWCVLTLFMKGLSKPHAKKLLSIAEKLETGDLDSIASYKLALSITGFSDARISLPPVAEPLADWFRAWENILWKTVDVVRRRRISGSDKKGSRRDENEPDWETAGGTYTRESLKAALSKAFPIPDHPDDPDEYAELQETNADGDDEPSAPSQAGAPPQRKQASGARKARSIKQPVLETESDIRSRLRPRPPRV